MDDFNYRLGCYRKGWYRVGLLLAGGLLLSLLPGRGFANTAMNDLQFTLRVNSAMPQAPSSLLVMSRRWSTYRRVRS